MAEFNISRFKYIWKGVWQSGQTYSKDDILAVGGKAYVCLIGHIGSAAAFDDDLNAVDQFGNAEPRWELLADGTKWTGNWTANKKYNQNELVKDGATIYRCTVGHTSDALTVNGLLADLEKWEFVAKTVQWRNAWVQLRKYKVGDLVLYSGITYECVEEHTANTTISGLEADLSKWVIVNVSDRWENAWTPSTRYQEYDIVTYSGLVYRSLISHTSSSINLDTDSANWEIVASDIKYQGEWNPNTVYYKNDVVSVDSYLYVALDTHTSDSIFTTITWQVYLPGMGFDGEWSPSIEYQAGDIVKYGGYSYICPLPSSVGPLPSEEWILLNTGYSFKNDFDISLIYRTGDVVRFGGNLFVATSDSYGAYPVYNKDVYTYAVTVGPVLYQGSQVNGYFIDGTPWKQLYIVQGQTYIFDQSDVSNLTHPMYFSLSYDGHHTAGTYNYVSPGVTYKLDGVEVTPTEYSSGFATATTRTIEVNLTNNFIDRIFPVCFTHPGMYRSLANGFPVERNNNWSQIVSGKNWRNSWELDTEYYPGDVIVYNGSPFICVQLHQADASTLVRPDKDDGSYWQLMILGSLTNRLNARGDLKIGSDPGTGFETSNLAIGSPGDAIMTQPPTTTLINDVGWSAFEAVPSLFYVSLLGTDQPNGGSKGSPFRTVKYACEHIAEDLVNRTPATILVQTGTFAEQLPIIVPKDTAIVGDELRSTTIKPAFGYEADDMFWMHNGSGLRNMTLSGLFGTLGNQNEYFTRRPSAGAFVALDPGLDPDDESVWITNKSPYVQNVSTFGTGCVGLKIDGDLHNGGNKSIVANDFTQVLSDGIGVWVNGDARSELVSVFAYYNHIGYLAEHGGTIRATNGNSSYGDYGCVAEGFLASETPITASVDHRALDAQIGKVYVNKDGGISALGYTNAGEDYTTANYNIVGNGIGANLSIGDDRKDSIFELRLLEPNDSTSYKGVGWTFVSNYSASGNATSITLSSADENLDSAVYEGLTIFINDGPGSGQYGIISSYDVPTKVATITDINGLPGWSHVQPGYPIEQSLGDSSRYYIEPTVNIAPPEFASELQNTGSFKIISAGVISPDLSIALPATGTVGAYSTNGSTWQNVTLSLDANYVKADYDGTFYWSLTSTGRLSKTLNGTNWTYYDFPLETTYNNMFMTGNLKIITRSDSANIYLATTTGNSLDDWSEVTVAEGLTGIDFITYINGYIIVANASGDMYSSQNGIVWSSMPDPTGNLDTGALGEYTVSSIAAGNNILMVALKSVLGISTSIYKYALFTDYAANGISWYFSGNSKTNSLNPTSTNKFYLTYQGGLFFALSESGSINTSQDALHWKVEAPMPGAYTGVVSGYNSRQRFLFLKATNASDVTFVNAGARTIARPNVVTERIENFYITEPGSGYMTQPVINVIDPNKVTDVIVDPRIGSGCLSVPTIQSSGIEYINATATVTGTGYADIYPVGQVLYINNLSRQPGPGDTITIAGIPESFSIQKIEHIEGNEPFLTAKLQVTPNIGITESPNHLTGIIIRQRYSQVRLTGHDFLDVGTGNFSDTAYPALYNFGYDPGENNPKPNQEVSFGGGGRVFYTSTDQDGNFRVGELFKVEQASGTVTISATQFNLEGLTELRLGGIVLGGSSAVIREFSTDPTFIANSDSIIPTQKAITAYISNRITSGGANANVNTAIAGNVVIGGNTITNRAGNTITVKVPTNLIAISGSFVALQLFTKK
jgi:hypothetical protein